MNLNFKEFCNTIQEDLKETLGNNYSLEIHQIRKNNNLNLQGLTIRKNGCNLSPTFYLDYYYEDYQDGKSLEVIKEKILEAYRVNTPDKSVSLSFFTNWETAKNKIAYKLVNYEMNKELLKDIPHYCFLDMAIVFFYLLEENGGTTATILIHNHHMMFWNVSLDKLYSVAFKNTPLLLNYEIRGITEVLNINRMAGTLEAPDILDAPEATDEYLYVLTNKSKLYGAGCILYKNILKDFADKKQCDLYILPSSVHEVLLVPTKMGMPNQDLTAMVREVNATQVLKEEILSDHVYYYSRETGLITM